MQVVIAAWFLAVALSLSTWSEAEHRVSSAESSDVAAACLANCTTNYTLADFCTPNEFASCHQLCPTVSCQFVRYTKNKDYSWMQLANVFGLYWGLFFFSAYGELVLAGVFAEW